jgi:hypothetical protein
MRLLREAESRLAQSEARAKAQAAELEASLDDCRKESWTKRLFKRGGA